MIILSRFDTAYEGNGQMELPRCACTAFCRAVKIAAVTQPRALAFCTVCHMRHDRTPHHCITGGHIDNRYMSDSNVNVAVTWPPAVQRNARAQA